MTSSGTAMMRTEGPTAAALTLALLGLLSCVSVSAQDRSDRLHGVGSFAFQLQETDLDRIGDSPFDLVVIDYSADGSEDTEWAQAEIGRLRHTGRIVLAYFSIAEAEDYRFYWKRRWRRKPPKWLGRVNANWPGNYKTRYWDPEWQSLLREYLNRIVDQGFDGVYLDIVDAYWYWAHEAPAVYREQETADRMIELIEMLAKHVRVARGRSDFLVVAQNATGITHNASTALKQRYWDTIDGIGVEDTFYFGGRDEDNEYAPQSEVLQNLEMYRLREIPIFAIEYLSADNTQVIDEFRRLNKMYGMIGYHTTRALDELRIP